MYKREKYNFMKQPKTVKKKSKLCVKCGKLYLPNTNARIRCYTCSPKYYIKKYNNCLFCNEPLNLNVEPVKGYRKPSNYGCEKPFCNLNCEQKYLIRLYYERTHKLGCALIE